MRHLVVRPRHRDLLWLWVLRENQVRDKQSVLSVTSAVLQPRAVTAIFTIAFSQPVRVDTGGSPYPIFSYSALVSWTSLATALSFGTASLIDNTSFVTNIYFSRETLPLASIGAASVGFLASAVILVGVIFIYQMVPGWMSFRLYRSSRSKSG